jgi:Flp pilus assembly protein TadG
MSAVRRGRGERGSVSLLVVIMIPALLMAAGLVLDGGRQLQVRREATAAAAAAARAGTQVTEQEIHGRAIDPSLATGRALGALQAAGMSGSVAVAGNRVTVTVTANVDYLILPGSRAVASSSSATPRTGVVDGAPR